MITSLFLAGLTSAFGSIDQHFEGQTWLCSGQSNMAYTYQRALDSGFEPPNDILARLDELDLSYATIIRQDYVEAQPALAEGLAWQSLTSDTLGGASAVCLFAALSYAEETGEAVRFIQSAVGGSHIEAWLPREIMDTEIAADPELSAYFENPEGYLDDWRMRVYEAFTQQDPISAHIHSSSSEWPEIEDWPHLTVPGAWEALEIGDEDGTYWLATRFILEEGDLRGGAELFLGPVDDQDWTYVNDCLVGETYVWSRPRQYSVPASCLKVGENALFVRVYDNHKDGGFRGEPEDLRLELSNGLHIPLVEGWRFQKGGEVRLPVMALGSDQTTPSGLFNGMIAPLVHEHFDAVIWYQGEGNRNKSTRTAYVARLDQLMSSWRAFFQSPDLPFVIIQLPEFDAQGDGHGQNFGKIRLAQFLASQRDPNAYLVAGLGEGVAHDIHPWDKTEFGYRVARELILKGSELTRGLTILSQDEGMLSLSGACALDLNPGVLGVEGQPAFEFCSAEGCYPAEPIQDGTVIKFEDVRGGADSIIYAGADLPDAQLTCGGEVLPAFIFHFE